MTKPAVETCIVSPRMAPSWAEQGTPRARRMVTMRRSFLVSRIRAVIVAMVSQPRPRTIGRIALPLRPMIRKRRLDMMASRGRVARVLEHAEGEKEGPHDGQDDGDGVGQAHGDQAVLADEHPAEELPGNQPHHLLGGGVEVLAEDHSLEDSRRRGLPPDCRRGSRVRTSPRGRSECPVSRLSRPFPQGLGEKGPLPLPRSAPPVPTRDRTCSPPCLEDDQPRGLN